MTTPININKDVLNESNDAALTEQLRALPQVEPSAELDATILGKIEHALKLEAEQKNVVKATQETSRVTHPKPRQHFFQSLERKIKQFWFIPVGAMAVLLASTSLNQPRPFSEQITTTIPDKEVASTTDSSAQKPSSDAPSPTLEMAKTDSQVSAAPGQDITSDKRKDFVSKSVDSKKMSTELAQLIEKKSRERVASKDTSKMASTNELAQISESAMPSTKAVAKSDQISSNAMSAPAAPIVAEGKASSDRTGLSANLQRVEVTGSSIKRVAVESSMASAVKAAPESSAERSTERRNAVQNLSKNDHTDDKLPTKTELYAVKELYEPNVKLAQEEKKVARASSHETTALIEAPKPMAIVPEPPRPPTPITPPLESYRELPHPVDVIRERLEQLIILGRTVDALQLWNDYKENYPRAGLPPDLQKKLEALERKQNTKQK